MATPTISSDLQAEFRAVMGQLRIARIVGDSDAERRAELRLNYLVDSRLPQPSRQ